MADMMRVDNDVVGTRREGDVDPRGPVAAAPPTSAEWGIASLALGAVIALLVPGALGLTHSLEAEGWEHNTGSMAHVTAFMGCGTIFFMLCLTLVATIFGAMGIGASLRQRRPVALGLAGFLLNGLNFFMWIGVTIAWIGTAWRHF